MVLRWEASSYEQGTPVQALLANPDTALQGHLVLEKMLSPGTLRKAYA